MDSNELPEQQMNGSENAGASEIKPERDAPIPISQPSFEPTEDAPLPSAFALPDTQWLSVLSAPCTFPPEIFTSVMLNLVKSPNLTSSHLFRADIFYDSDTDRMNHSGNLADGLAKHLKPEYRPIPAQWPGFTLERTMVRQMIPRNPKLDPPLLQTCHFFRRQHASTEHPARIDTLVLYIPHLTTKDNTPFYHPRVQQLAFLHVSTPLSSVSITTQAAQETLSGSLYLLYLPFPPSAAEHPSSSAASSASISEAAISSAQPYASPPAAASKADADADADAHPAPLTPKLRRTALHLLATLHKHGHGQQAGYVKRVRLDRVVPQRAYQDTYARLKAAHGRRLAASWAEVTDPGKHVFEDLGIAAFLIELWKRLYSGFPLGDVPVGNAGGENDGDDGAGSDETGNENAGNEDAGDHGAGNEREDHGRKEPQRKPPWKGFVDIGCGNGVLVHVLLREGCGPGWGFDARERKSWRVLDEGLPEGALQRRVLVPRVLSDAVPTTVATSASPNLDYGGSQHDGLWHDGLFVPDGTFIVSNHADQLTLWTPLLAWLNHSHFIAIPCCSHDFAGARFRAPPGLRTTQTAKREKARDKARPDDREKEEGEDGGRAHAAESGSLARGSLKNKPPSAYASLCTYVAALAEEVGFVAETETLRIPSTRNVCIVGRRWKGDRQTVEEHEGVRDQERMEKVVGIIEREMKRDVGGVAEDWIERVEGLMKKPGSGH